MAKSKSTKQLKGKSKRKPYKELNTVVTVGGDGKELQLRTALSQRAVLEFLTETRGHIGKACTLAGITRETYYQFCKDPDFAGAVEAIKQGITDDYIEALNTIALDAKFFPAVKYYLDNHAQDRGFGKEIQQPKNNPTPVNNIQINLATLPVETLKQLREHLTKKE